MTKGWNKKLGNIGSITLVKMYYVKDAYYTHTHTHIGGLWIGQ